MDNVLDVLLFLFENYLEEELTERGPGSALRDELDGVGFPPEAIDHAFEWLDGLDAARDMPDAPVSRTALRVYAAQEQRKLSSHCRGFIHYLEQLGILPPAQRERVIERLMALEPEQGDISDTIEVDHVKWTVLMVLFSQPQLAEAYERMEDLAFPAERLH